MGVCLFVYVFTSARIAINGLFDLPDVHTDNLFMDKIRGLVARILPVSLVQARIHFYVRWGANTHTCNIVARKFVLAH